MYIEEREQWRNFIGAKRFSGHLIKRIGISTIKKLILFRELAYFTAQ